MKVSSDQQKNPREQFTSNQNANYTSIYNNARSEVRQPNFGRENYKNRKKIYLNSCSIPPQKVKDLVQVFPKAKRGRRVRSKICLSKIRSVFLLFITV